MDDSAWGKYGFRLNKTLGFDQPFAEKKELKHEIELWNK